MNIIFLFLLFICCFFVGLTDIIQLIHQTVYCFCMIIFVLFPNIIGAIFVLNKTKSTTESFVKFQSNVNKIILKQVADSDKSWFSKKCEEVLLYIAKRINLSSPEPIFFDIGVANVCLKISQGTQDKLNVYLGILGGWFPI